MKGGIDVVRLNFSRKPTSEAAGKSWSFGISGAYIGGAGLSLGWSPPEGKDIFDEYMEGFTITGIVGIGGEIGFGRTTAEIL